jgi:hypothetical protein
MHPSAANPASMSAAGVDSGTAEAAAEKAVVEDDR